jgi:hypothetical protein
VATPSECYALVDREQSLLFQPMASGSISMEVIAGREWSRPSGTATHTDRAELVAAVRRRLEEQAALQEPARASREGG